ncbi:MAG TPA: hypothetical protein VET46_01150 [Steroidobacteraceae bacterium]|nr:hypothetical protein [Steroidobacteraceae bacterium]
MKTFVARYRSAIIATLSGFDRLVFRGTLVGLVRKGGMQSFLNSAGVRLLDFKQYVSCTSEQVKDASLRVAIAQGRPIRYLESARTDKEALAHQLLAEQPIEQGLICAFRTVEPCMSFEYHRSAEPRERGLRLRPRKCLHIYQYFLHPIFGFMSARLQTWFPFNIQICLNGREWLGRQFQCKGHTDFTRDANCFTHLGDAALAQRLMTQQLRTGWPRALDPIARTLNPLHPRIFRRWPHTYYWSAYQTEWATDVMFAEAATLAAIYPDLVRHASLHFQSPDVMRFLGRKGLHGTFQGKLVSSCQRRPEGVRIKHWVQGNSLKMYNKAPQLLRVETTIGNPAEFQVLRPRERARRRPLAWQPLRKGVADLHRRAAVSQRANERYLDALAATEDSTPLHQLLDQVARRVRYHGRHVRALRMGDAQDLALLQAISRGEFALAGLRNRDLRRLLYPSKRPVTGADARRLSARISRQLRLLRAHGVIKKLSKTHRYQLTTRGRLLCAALFAVREATLQKLVGSAAA